MRNCITCKLAHWYNKENGEILDTGRCEAIFNISVPKSVKILDMRVSISYNDPFNDCEFYLER